jgi:hypothetical protein
MRSVSFLVETQNQGRRFVSGLASKPLRRFLWFDLKIGGDGFIDLAQVFQSDFKTSGDMMTGGTCGTITDVVLESN